MRIQQIPVLLLTAFLACFAAVGVARAETLKEVMAKADAYYAAGNYEEALKAYHLVYQNSRSPRAMAKLKKCEEQIRMNQHKTVDLGAELSRILIPEVSFKNADLGTVLEYLRVKTEELSGGKVKANFVYNGPREDLKDKTVNFSLRSTPVTQILSYIGSQTGIRFTFEPYAVVGAPASEGSGSNQPATPTSGLGRTLSEIKIAEVTLKEADLDTALEFLRQKTAEAMNGSQSFNIIYSGPPEDLKSKIVNFPFKLSNIPAAVLLDYVGRQTDVIFRYESFAVVGRPMEKEMLTSEPGADNPGEEKADSSFPIPPPFKFDQ